ncbi:Lar family restriction alleviation protein [Ralstonia mannitolilytica]|uniref:Lar family restriction alleviation protein n=1 Tax=Ralstonia mannitolilytica TaxID=105219 RepID=UPI0009EE76C6
METMRTDKGRTDDFGTRSRRNWEAGVNEPKLLPCPFCGGEANQPNYDGQYMSASVICMTCGATTFGTGFKLSAMDEARSNWNRRTQPSVQGGE